MKPGAAGGGETRFESGRSQETFFGPIESLVGEGFVRLVLEAVLTFFWGLAVFAGLRRGAHPLLGPVLIGAAVAVGILTAGILTGAAMNPARAFGPALASGAWSNQMVYWIGPLIGGALAGIICGHFLFNDEEEDAPAAYPAR